MNVMHPNSPFYIDPKTYRVLRNPNYQPDMNGTSSGTGRDMASLIKYYKGFGATDKEALAYAHRDITNDKIRKTTNPYKPLQTKTSESYSPGAQQTGYNDDYENNYPMNYMTGIQGLE